MPEILGGGAGLTRLDMRLMAISNVNQGPVGIMESDVPAIPVRRALRILAPKYLLPPISGGREWCSLFGKWAKKKEKEKRLRTGG